MPPSISAIVLQLLMDAPEFFADAEKLVTGVSTGEGGIAKIANLASNLGTLTGHVATALTQAAATAQPAIEPNPVPTPAG